jgi:hypothetical protein
VLAFEYFGAIPGRVRYDNLGPAVVRVLRGRARAESERFIALRSHYGFDSLFCIPGTEGAHEKGGVEGEIGRFRRRHLAPVPAVASLAALNQRIAAADMVDDGRVITGRPVTVAAAFAGEQPAMLPLPAEMFDPARLLAARVDGRARVCVRQNYYSVPARYAGRRLPVRLSATAIEVLDGSRVVARHGRAAGKYAETLVLDHYLEVLRYKPGALPGAAALARARAAGTFTAAHQGYRDAARRQHGDAAGTRALIEVLLAHRTVPAAALEAAMTRAVTSRVLDAQAVLIDARRQAGRQAAAVIPIGELGYAQVDPPALSCCSRSSPSETNEPPSRSGPTCRSANGAPSSPTPAWWPRSSTGSPSTPTSWRPAPSPTGSPSARPPAAAQSPANAVRRIVGVV